MKEENQKMNLRKDLYPSSTKTKKIWNTYNDFKLLAIDRELHKEIVLTDNIYYLLEYNSNPIQVDQVSMYHLLSHYNGKETLFFLNDFRSTAAHVIMCGFPTIKQIIDELLDINYLCAMVEIPIDLDDRDKTFDIIAYILNNRVEILRRHVLELQQRTATSD